MKNLKRDVTMPPQRAHWWQMHFLQVQQKTLSFSWWVSHLQWTTTATQVRFHSRSCSLSATDNICLTQWEQKLMFLYSCGCPTCWQLLSFWNGLFKCRFFFFIVLHRAREINKLEQEQVLTCLCHCPHAWWGCRAAGCPAAGWLLQPIGS